MEAIEDSFAASSAVPVGTAQLSDLELAQQQQEESPPTPPTPVPRHLTASLMAELKNRFAKEDRALKVSCAVVHARDFLEFYNSANL